MKVCCRADVRDRFGIWTAVTDDVCARGCRLVTSKVPRVGSLLQLTLSSDLFAEVLEVSALAAWVSDQRVGVKFVASEARADRLSPAEWVERLIEHGKIIGPESVGSTGPRLAPAVRRPSPIVRATSRAAIVQPREEPESDDVLVLPVQHR